MFVSNRKFKNECLLSFVYLNHTHRQELCFCPSKDTNQKKTKNKKNCKDICGSYTNLLERCSVVWWDQMTIIWRWTSHDKFTEIVNGAVVCTERFNFCSSTLSQAHKLPKRDASSFNFFQRFTAIQHRLIKPSPRPCSTKYDKLHSSKRVFLLYIPEPRKRWQIF